MSETLFKLMLASGSLQAPGPGEGSRHRKAGHGAAKARETQRLIGKAMDTLCELEDQAA